MFTFKTTIIQEGPLQTIQVSYGSGRYRQPLLDIVLSDEPGVTPILTLHTSVTKLFSSLTHRRTIHHLAFPTIQLPQ